MRFSFSRRIFVLFGLAFAAIVAGCGSGGSVPANIPTITVNNPAPTVTYSTTPIVLSATSNSSGTITYAVVSGPATITGSTLTLTGVGTVVLQVSEAATADYAATSENYSFTVVQAVPTLAFAAVPTKVVGNAPFTVSATSASNGSVTYTVVSGPASVTGSTVTLNGTTGTVVLNASQAATVDYAAATAQTSFLVLASAAVCPTSGTLFCGLVYANGYPVIGAQVQIYAAGNTGAGSTPTALTTALTTNASGLFAVPSTLACPTAGRAVYALAKGGLVQGPNASNSDLWLMTALPACGSLPSSGAISVMVNELSTMASAVTLAQFYANGGNTGATATNAAGLASAMAMEQELVSLGTGTSPGAAPPNVTVNSAKLNTLADALSACAAAASGCGPLFAAATVNGTAPTNTLDAAFNITRHPGANAAAIYALTMGDQYTPVVASQPPDWMIFNTIAGGGLTNPTGMGVDGYGNVWVASYTSPGEVLAEFTQTGAAVYANGISNAGLNESWGLAVDASNNIWVEDEELSFNKGGDILVFNNAGTALNTPGYTANIYWPTGISVDLNGDIWISNYGNSTYALYSPTGSSITTNCGTVNNCGYGQLVFPVAVVADANHVGWFGNQSDNTVTRVPLNATGITRITCCDGASGMAVDPNGNIWAANYYGDSLSELSPSGTVLLNGVTGGGQTHHPQGIEADSAGNIWTTNYRGNSISELAGATAAAISPTTGYGTDASLLEPYALVIDASGNVWVSNYAQVTVVEFLGAAAPVKTPTIGPPQAP